MSTVSTIGLTALMIVYLLMTVIGSAHMADQTEIISEHPFEVVIAAGDAELYLSEMSLRTGRLQRHHSAEDVEFADTELGKLYDLLEQPLMKLEELYLGDPEDIQKLRDTLALLETEQGRFLSYAGGSDVAGESIETYEQEHLAPLYTKALNETGHITAVAQEKKVGYGDMAEALRKTCSSALLC